MVRFSIFPEMDFVWKIDSFAIKLIQKIIAKNRNQVANLLKSLFSSNTLFVAVWQRFRKKYHLSVVYVMARGEM